MTEPQWIGPYDSDFESDQHTKLKKPVPPERWPYGPPDKHEFCCSLGDGGLFCDCKASDLSNLDFGESV